MRSRFVTTALLLTAFLTGACNRDRRKLIAVIPKGTAHLFWVSVQTGALAAGKQFNVDVLWNGPAQETEYDRQIQILDAMVARHVDGIAIAAAERTALVQPIDRAVDAGIPSSYSIQVSTRRSTPALSRPTTIRPARLPPEHSPERSMPGAASR